jgi:putative PIN family toxin of toxin-antitoxin system
MKDGHRHRLIERARRQRVRLFVSEYILQELSDTLVEDLGQSLRYANLACQAVRRKAKTVELPPSIVRHVPGDPNDDPIVQTALSAKADYLVTADQEILKVGKVQDVQIIAALQFEELLASSA